MNDSAILQVDERGLSTWKETSSSFAVGKEGKAAACVVRFLEPKAILQDDVDPR